MNVPIRTRLILVSAGLVAAVLAAVGVFVYLRLEADLLEAVDAGLRSRADALLASPVGSTAGVRQTGDLAEPDDAFAQLLAPDGRVVSSSPGLRRRAVLPPGELADLREPRLFEAEVRAVEEVVPARILAVPAGGGRVLAVGASLEDQRDALTRLATLLAIGGPLALAVVVVVIWRVVAAALRPVETMRAEAAAISASEPDRRLPVSGSDDELARLGETLNAMLERLQGSIERERRFVDDASHELRTPLANLKTELDLALRRSRTAEELALALGSASEETDRLALVAEDLLVLARSDRGRLSVRREPLQIAGLLHGAVEPFLAGAAERGVLIQVSAPDGLWAGVDGLQMRRALGNLVDNAVRHTPSGGRVTISGKEEEGSLVLRVRDTGSGFPSDFLPRAFERFARPDAARGRPEGGAGLGLAIVRAVAEAHGGVAEASNPAEGGAEVLLRIPDSSSAHPPLTDAGAS